MRRLGSAAFTALLVGGCSCNPAPSGGGDAGAGADAGTDGGKADGGSDGGADGGAVSLVLSRTAIDFGPTYLGTTATAVEVQLTNQGDLTSGPVAVYLGGASSPFRIESDACSNVKLVHAQHCAVQVSFRPLAQSAAADKLVFQVDPGGVLQVDLAGKGVLAALGVSPASRSFGEVEPGAPADLAVDVQNTGDAPTGPLAADFTGTDAAQWSVVAAPTNPCVIGQPVAANSTCHLGLRFSPAGWGARTATVTVSATPGGSLPVDLSGTGIADEARIVLQEETVQGQAALGMGYEVQVDFRRTPALPVYTDDLSNPAVGCRVWEYTAAEWTALATVPDEGAVNFTVSGGSLSIPGCNQLTTAGRYGCFGGFGTPDSVSCSAGSCTITQASGSFTSKHLGRWLSLSAAPSAANDGLFPILSVPGATTLVYANAAGVSEALGSPALYGIEAGRGPIPGVTEPGFLLDTDKLTVALVPGGLSEWTAFTAPSIDAGDHFALDPSSKALDQIAVDGAAFRVGCDATGGNCGAAALNELTLVTSDGATAGLPSAVLPPPAAKAVVIRCGAPGSATGVDVSAAASAHLASSGAKRIRGSYLRAGTADPASSHPVHIRVGHAVVGYSDH
jgi:hypothetical protein